MALKNVLLHVDSTRACDARENAAIALAGEHEAHLTALYCIGEIHIEGWAEWPTDMIEEHRNKAAEYAERTLARFREKAERAGISYETRSSRVYVSRIGEHIALHARYSDLAILGQNNPDEFATGGTRIVEDVLFSCGRPVLVIPYIGAPGEGRKGGVSFGHNAMVAWDAGRESARAVNDALPLLERARQVEVVAVNPDKGLRHHGEEPGADIALHLARHGIDVDVKAVEARDLGTADTILSRISDRGSDLLIMGGYGHGRMREMVLGGVTRNILRHMTVPVLMSH
jgi:nucleotide-binding universal stress UspA family protein